MKFLYLVSVLVAIVVYSAGASAGKGSGAIYTWQNSNGYWFACGPGQCLQVGVKSEKRAIEMVTTRSHTNIDYIREVGKCSYYTVQNVWNYEYSASKARRRANC